MKGIEGCLSLKGTLASICVLSSSYGVIDFSFYNITCPFPFEPRYLLFFLRDGFFFLLVYLFSVRSERWIIFARGGPLEQIRPRNHLDPSHLSHITAPGEAPT
jgi:hypothetical protein